MVPGAEAIDIPADPGKHISKAREERIHEYGFEVPTSIDGSNDPIGRGTSVMELVRERHRGSWRPRVDTSSMPRIRGKGNV